MRWWWWSLETGGGGHRASARGGGRTGIHIHPFLPSPEHEHAYTHIHRQAHHTDPRTLTRSSCPRRKPSQRSALPLRRKRRRWPHFPKTVHAARRMSLAWLYGGGGGDLGWVGGYAVPLSSTPHRSHWITDGGGPTDRPSEPSMRPGPFPFSQQPSHPHIHVSHTQSQHTHAHTHLHTCTILAEAGPRHSSPRSVKLRDPTAWPERPMFSKRSSIAMGCGLVSDCLPSLVVRAAALWRRRGLLGKRSPTKRRGLQLQHSAAAAPPACFGWGISGPIV